MSYTVPVAVVKGNWSARTRLALRTSAGSIADLGGKQVHGPLDGGRGLGAPCTSVGRQGRGVGHYRAGEEARPLDVVGPRQHLFGEVGQERPDLGVSAGVLHYLEVVSSYLAVTGSPDGHVLDLAPSMAEPQHALGTGLRPAHRALEPVGQPADEELLRVRLSLGPKTSTYIRGNDTDLALVHSNCLGQLLADRERRLGGRVVT